MIEQICEGFENGCMCMDCCRQELGNLCQELGLVMIAILITCCIVGFVFRKTKCMKKFMKWAF